VAAVSNRQASGSNSSKQRPRFIRFDCRTALPNWQKKKVTLQLRGATMLQVLEEMAKAQK
jgi:hypothetical protein